MSGSAAPAPCASSTESGFPPRLQTVPARYRAVSPPPRWGPVPNRHRCESLQRPAGTSGHSPRRRLALSAGSRPPPHRRRIGLSDATVGPQGFVRQARAQGETDQGPPHRTRRRLVAPGHFKDSLVSPAVDRTATDACSGKTPPHIDGRDDGDGQLPRTPGYERGTSWASGKTFKNSRTTTRSRPS